MIVNTKPKHISDEQLLEMMEHGQIEIVDLDSPSPALICYGRVKRPELTEQRGSRRIVGNTRWTWQIWYGGKRRRIVRARLVWMYVHRKVIGDGYTIHHIDEDRHNDSRDNLVRMTCGAHAGLHSGYLDEE